MAAHDDTGGRMQWEELRPRERLLIGRLMEALIHAQTLAEVSRGTGELLSQLNSREAHSQRDQALGRYVSTLVELTVHKCQRFLEGELDGRLLQSLVREHGVALLVVVPPDTIVRRTDAVAALLRRWFDPTECEPSGVPRVLLEKLASLTGRPEMKTGVWDRTKGDSLLKVTFTRVERTGAPACWRWTFQELAHPLLATWLEQLTPKEREVALLLIEGKSNKELAPLAGCEVETLKVHLKNIYRKTGTRGRAEFIALALKNA